MNRRAVLILALTLPPATRAADADLILHNGKVVAVDAKFAVHQALAVKDGKILLRRPRRRRSRGEGASARRSST